MQERAQRTRERALDAAASEFAERGYAQTTINSVTERMGMSKGAIYGHFSSKRDLADALTAHSKVVWEELSRDSRGCGRTPAAALEESVIALSERIGTDVRMRAAVRLAVEAQPGSRGCCSSLLTRVHRDLAGMTRRIGAQGRGDGPEAHSVDIPGLLADVALIMACREFYRLDGEWAGAYTSTDRSAALRLLVSGLVVAVADSGHLPETFMT